MTPPDRPPMDEWGALMTQLEERQRNAIEDRNVLWDAYWAERDAETKDAGRGRLPLVLSPSGLPDEGSGVPQALVLLERATTQRSVGPMLLILRQVIRILDPLRR
jgi:hypothetical protein